RRFLQRTNRLRRLFLSQQLFRNNDSFNLQRRTKRFFTQPQTLDEDVTFFLPIAHRARQPQQRVIAARDLLHHPWFFFLLRLAANISSPSRSIFATSSICCGVRPAFNASPRGSARNFTHARSST